MKLNIVSNYAQQVVNISLRFFMIPVYVEAFGLGGYGLIGFYISISSILVLLDFGMGYASIKLLAEGDSASSASDIAVLRFVEKIYLCCALLIGVFVYFMADLIVESWLTVDAEETNAILTIQLMALLLLVTWPQSLYQSFLMGQQRFVAMNIVMMASHIIVAAVMLFGIKSFGLGVNFYFVVMASVMLLQTIALRFLAWNRLFSVPKIKITKGDIKRFFSHAAGVSVFSLCSLAFFQGPLLTLSSLSTTSELGLYNLAMTFPMALITLMYPIGSVFLSKLVKINEDDDAKRKFESATFLMGSFITSGIAILLLNMEWLYLFWLGEDQVPYGLDEVSRFLAKGTFFYGFAMVMTNALLINGKTKQLSAAYLLALVWFGFNVLELNDFVSAERIARFWKDVSFISMIFVLLAGFLSFPLLVIEWVKNVALVFVLSLIAGLVLWSIQLFSEITAFLNLVLSVLTFAILFFPKTYKVIRAL